MKKIDEIKKICLSHYDVHVYRHVFKKNLFFMIFAASNKKKSECTANKASSI